MTQQQDRDQSYAMFCYIDGLTISPEIVKLMPSLGQVVQFSRLFSGMAPLTQDHH